MSRALPEGWTGNDRHHHRMVGIFTLTVSKAGPWTQYPDRPAVYLWRVGIGSPLSHSSTIVAAVDEAGPVPLTADAARTEAIARLQAIVSEVNTILLAEAFRAIGIFQEPSDV